MGMLPFLIAGLAGLAILLVAVGIAMSGGSGGVAGRLERYASGREPSEVRHRRARVGGDRRASRARSIARASPPGWRWSLRARTSSCGRPST